MLDVTGRIRSVISGQIRQRRGSVAVLLIYLLLAVAMTWPVAAQLGTRLPGGSVDIWSHWWTFWNVKQSVVQGHSPLHTD